MFLSKLGTYIMQICGLTIPTRLILVSLSVDLLKTSYLLCILPENRWAANVYRLQCSSLQKFITQAVVEGTVKARGTSVFMQYSETFHFVFPVDQQLCFVAINTDQNHILHDCSHITAQ